MGNTLRNVITRLQTGVRLVSADDVKDIINKYAKTNAEAHLMTYKVECLTGVMATTEQMLILKTEGDVKFDD